MAKGQSGSNAITVWMIVFVGLWLTSTVFLVIMYTGQQDLVAENTRLRAAKDKLISSREEGSIDLVRQANASGPTVVGLLEQARAQTAEVATGNPSDDAGTVENQRDQLLDSFRAEGLIAKAGAYQGLSYHAALSKLYSDYRSVYQKWQSAQESLLETQTELATLGNAAETLRAEYARRTQELTDQFAAVESGRADYRKGRDTAVAAMESEYEAARALNTEILTKARQDLQACSEGLTEAQARFTALRERLGGLMQSPQELATARQPDGEILTAVPGDGVVYINLGQRNGLTLGLHFTVYTAESGIPTDGRGKGLIEVVSISESSAECRILRVARNRVLLDGDLIGNPVYDPNRSLTFVVIGQFDIDRDGLRDSGGAATVVSLVERWGGTVVDDVTPLTDFVVVGMAPRKPRPTADVPADQQAQNRSHRRAWDAYHKTLSDADLLGMPVLAQEVFMNFIGVESNRVTRR